MLQILRINDNTYSKPTLKLPLDIIYKIFEYDPTFYIYKTKKFNFELSNNIFEKMESIIKKKLSYEFYKNSFGFFIQNEYFHIQDDIMRYNDFKICSKKYNYYRLFSVIPINYDKKNVTEYESIIYKYKDKDKIPEKILQEYSNYYHCNPFIVFLEKIKKYILLLEINDIKNIQRFDFDININYIFNFINVNDFVNCINRYAKEVSDNEYIIQINKNYKLQQPEIIIPKNKQLLLEIKNHEFNVVKEFVDDICYDDSSRLTQFNYFYDFNYDVKYKLYFIQEKYYKKFAILPIDFNTNNVTKYDGIVFKYKNKNKIPKEVFEYYNSSENYMEIFINNAKEYFSNLSKKKNFNIFPYMFNNSNFNYLTNNARNFSNETNIIYVHYF
jgi:hypothetical protein